MIFFIYALISGVLMANLFIVALCLLFTKKLIIELKPGALIFFFTIICLRAFIPLDLSNGKTIINSYVVYPKILEHKRIIAVLLSIWLIGFVILLSRTILTYYNFYRKMRYLEGAADHRIYKILEQVMGDRISDKGRIIINASIKSPLEFGFFQYTILLPNYDFSEKELQFILTHELNHFYNRSDWIKLLLNILCDFLWWNPFMNYMRDTVEYLLELYCDEWVVEGFDHSDKLEYLKCILHIKKRSGNDWKELKTTNQFIALKNKVILTRFESILHKRKNYKTNVFLGISLLLILASYVIIVQPSYHAPDFPDINASNSYIMEVCFEDYKYILYYNNKPFLELNDLAKLGMDIPVRKQEFVQDD